MVAGSNISTMKGIQYLCRPDMGAKLSVKCFMVALKSGQVLKIQIKTQFLIGWSSCRIVQ